jgi:hypothetical protein
MYKRCFAYGYIFAISNIFFAFLQFKSNLSITPHIYIPLLHNSPRLSINQSYKMRSTTFLATLLLAPLSVLAGAPPASETNTKILLRNSLMKPLVARTPMHILVRSPRPDEDEVCSSDEVRCGDVCVPDTYSCCPHNVSGGCPADEKCRKNDGKYGCCADGEDCHWENDDDDDDDSGIFSNIKDNIEDFGDDVEDGWDDLVDNAGQNLKPELITIGALFGVAAVMVL